MIGKCLRKIIAIIILLYIKEKEIFPAYISDINLNWEKHNLFMIPNEQKEGWYVLAVKKLSPVLHGILSNHKVDFYCLNCFHSFRTEINFNFMKKYVKRLWIFCGIVMSLERYKIL